jgi:Tripartite tricarboxylate transporter family receptor
MRPISESAGDGHRVVHPADRSTSWRGMMRKVLQRALGQRFVVENRPGAGGKIGISYAAKASPDGAVELTIGYWDRSCIHR